MLIFQITIYDEDLPGLRSTSISRLDLDALLASDDLEKSFTDMGVLLRKDWDDALGGFIDKFRKAKAQRDG